MKTLNCLNGTFPWRTYSHNILFVYFQQSNDHLTTPWFATFGPVFASFHWIGPQVIYKGETIKG